MGVADVALESGRSELVIYELIQAGRLHFVEDDKGHILVCFSSVRQLEKTIELGSNQEGEDHER
jgi:hypothetical protein